MLTIIAAKSVNYEVPSDTQILEYFSNTDLAILFAKEYLSTKKAKDVTEVLQPDPDNYKFNARIEYKSYYGEYPCAIEFKIIHVRQELGTYI